MQPKVDGNKLQALRQPAKRAEESKNALRKKMKCNYQLTVAKYLRVLQYDHTLKTTPKTGKILTYQQSIHKIFANTQIEFLANTGSPLFANKMC